MDSKGLLALQVYPASQEYRVSQVHLVPSERQALRESQASPELLVSLASRVWTAWKALRGHRVSVASRVYLASVVFLE